MTANNQRRSNTSVLLSLPICPQTSYCCTAGAVLTAETPAVQNQQAVQENIYYIKQRTDSHMFCRCNQLDVAWNLKAVVPKHIVSYIVFLAMCIGIVVHCDCWTQLFLRHHEIYWTVEHDMRQNKSNTGVLPPVAAWLTAAVAASQSAYLSGDFAVGGTNTNCTTCSQWTAPQPQLYNTSSYIIYKYVMNSL